MPQTHENCQSLHLSRYRELTKALSILLSFFWCLLSGSYDLHSLQYPIDLQNAFTKSYDEDLFKTMPSISFIEL